MAAVSRYVIELIATAIPPDDITVYTFPVSIRLQACNDTICLPPEYATVYPRYPPGSPP